MIINTVYSRRQQADLCFAACGGGVTENQVWDMSYFNYHAKAQRLIAQGHLTDYAIVDNWNGISPALVLYFDNNRPMPIREYMWDVYFKILSKMG